MTPTATPQDLITAIARAVADSATPDDRRAGRRAALLLASTLGEPGEPMHLGAAPPPRSAIDGAQLVDLAIAKLRAFLDEQNAKSAAPPALAPAPASPPPPTPTSSSSSGASTAAPPPPPRPRMTTPPLRFQFVGSRRP